MTILSRAILPVVIVFLVLGAGEVPPPDVVAQRGDIRLTAKDLKDTLNLLDPASRAQVTANPQTLSNFVRERLLNLSVLAEARGKSWDTRPDVARRITEARDSVILQTYLAAVVPNDPMFPTEAEVSSAYEANKGHLIAPKQFRLAQIVLTVKSDATAEEDEAVRKKAVEVQGQAARPRADFAELAKKNSQDAQSAGKGGDVGWLREPDIMPTVRDAVAGLPENGVSQALRVPDGWHILKLLETKPAGQIPLLDAKPQIVQALRQARTQRLIRAYLDDMLKTQPLEVNEIELTKQAGPGK